MHIWKIAGCVLLLAVPGLTACGRDPSPAGHTHPAGKRRTPDAADARRFTQAFYDWYVPLDTGLQRPTWATVGAHRPHPFSPELLRALKDDEQAQDKDPGYIVGLDFDPVVASQDPCERYVVGDAVRSGSGYRVNVHSVCQGKRSSTPDVVVELVPHAASWSIVNLHYPQFHGDLIEILRQLAKDRSRPVAPAQDSAPAS